MDSILTIAPPGDTAVNLSGRVIVWGQLSCFDDKSGPVVRDASSNTRVEEFSNCRKFQGCFSEVVTVLSWAKAKGIEPHSVLNKHCE